MTKKIATWAAPLITLTLILALVLAAINKHQETEQDIAVAVSVPMELTSTSTVDGLSLGLIVSVGDNSTEGSQWAKAAAGAQVAVERLNRTGRNITLITQNDQGTPEGSQKAVQALIDQQVSGIIIASSGPHLAQGIDAAQEAGIPLIMPYQETNGQAWSLAPSQTQITQQAQSFARGSTRIYLIQQEGRSTPYPAHEAHTYTPGADPHQILGPIADYVNHDDNKNGTYSIILDADTYTLATLITAIQESGIHANILLSPDATSPVLSEALTNNDPAATVTLTASTIGHNIDDAVALQATPEGRSMSAYLQMVKVMGASSAPALYNDQPFADLAHSADARAHDSVIAFVKAAEKAQDKTPQGITQALNSLTLAPADGITAPSYDFSTPQAANAPVSVLHPSIGNLNLRTSSQSQRIVWFAPETH